MTKNIYIKRKQLQRWGDGPSQKTFKLVAIGYLKYNSAHLQLLYINNLNDLKI